MTRVWRCLDVAFMLCRNENHVEKPVRCVTISGLKYNVANACVDYLFCCSFLKSIARLRYEPTVM